MHTFSFFCFLLVFLAGNVSFWYFVELQSRANFDVSRYWIRSCTVSTTHDLGGKGKQGQCVHRQRGGKKQNTGSRRESAVLWCTCVAHGWSGCPGGVTVKNVRRSTEELGNENVNQNDQFDLRYVRDGGGSDRKALPWNGQQVLHVVCALICRQSCATQHFQLSSTPFLV